MTAAWSAAATPRRAGRAYPGAPTTARCRPRSLAQGAAGSPLDLAPGGVYRAAAVTCGAGGLLHHRFTLTPADAGAVCFLWHCPAGHPGSALPTTLPCGARTFLTGLAPGATARPTHPCSGYSGPSGVPADRPSAPPPAEPSLLLRRASPCDRREGFRHSGTACTRPYGVDVPPMLFERHERGIHALRTGRRARTASHGSTPGSQKHQRYGPRVRRGAARPRSG